MYFFKKIILMCVEKSKISDIFEREITNQKTDHILKPNGNNDFGELERLGEKPKDD